MPKANRPMPDDFAEVAHRLERRTGAIQSHYAAGQATVYRWFAEAGIPLLGSNRRPVPNDFAQVAPTLCLSALSKHYQTSDMVVRRWCKNTGINPARATNRGGKAPKPAPEGFAAIAPTLSITALCKQYGVNHRCIKRWLEEAGTYSKPYIAAPPKPRERRVSNPGAMSKMGRVNGSKLAPTRVKSIYDEAADVLRRERFLVNRCNERGGYDPKGKFWRVGWSTCTPDELLVRAARYERAAA